MGVIVDVTVARVVVDLVDVVSRQLFSFEASSYSFLLSSSSGFAGTNTLNEYPMKLFTSSLPVASPILFRAAMICSTKLITSLYLPTRIARSLQVRSLMALLLCELIPPSELERELRRARRSPNSVARLSLVPSLLINSDKVEI